MRILLVEDEMGLGEALEYILKKNKFLVDLVENGIDAEGMAETNIYDLIILDRMLPGKEGVEVLKYIRSIGVETPVIFLTAKDSLSNKVEGLDAGADDYLVKPFEMEELLARIRALGRRKESINVDGRLNLGGLSLDPGTCEAIYNEKNIKLTLKESQLLELLIKNQGQALTKEQILTRVWGYDTEADINSVELYVYYLRKKMECINSKVKINTIRGVGYCLKG